jgi:23S rRNA-/tRNA-specific pseudouridylate synthase
MKTIAQQLNVINFPFEIRDKNNNQIYFEGSKGDWNKQEFDSNNNPIYYEDSSGLIIEKEKNLPVFNLEIDLDGGVESISLCVEKK